MSRPVIVAVDDDAQVLGALRGDLRARYGQDYRIVVADTPAGALEAVVELRSRGEEVALFLVDQRMPVQTGTEFLLVASPHHPDAKKVLLTAYADTEAAIEAINEVGLDHYLLKPWDPPEDRLYPVLDDLLEDWHANRPALFDGIRVVGERWSSVSHETRDFLARNQVPYRFLDVERDEEARHLLGARTGDEALLPLVFLPDGAVLVQPTNRDLAERTGLHVQASAPFYDLVIIGAGPAGLAGAVYGASEGLRVVVVERQATGGQAGTSSRIENYLGFPNGISGADLARRATTQATRLGAEIITAADVTAIAITGTSRSVVLADGTSLTCKAVMVASGMKVRRLDVPGYEQLTGAGVYYGATLSEAAGYAGERIFIVGGANSAGQAAVMFSRYSDDITLLVRGDSLGAKMSQYLVDQVEADPNIRVLTGTEIAEVSGAGRLEEVVLRDLAAGTTRTEPAGALFVFVGAVPHTDFLVGVVHMNAQGFLPTGLDIPRENGRPVGWPLERDPLHLETNVPGVFAAGDVLDGAVRRVASAVGQGSVCISSIHRYLETV